MALSLHLRSLAAEDQSRTMRAHQYILLLLLGISPFQPQFHVSSPTYITGIQGNYFQAHRIAQYEEVGSVYRHSVDINAPVYY
jgi:hypothetical protein